MAAHHRLGPLRISNVNLIFEQSLHHVGGYVSTHGQAVRWTPSAGGWSLHYPVNTGEAKHQNGTSRGPKAYTAAWDDSGARSVLTDEP